jgi:hypothetical protein
MELMLMRGQKIFTVLMMIAMASTAFSGISPRTQTFTGERQDRDGGIRDTHIWGTAGMDDMQLVINAASDGDVIQVQDGAHIMADNSPICINKNLTFQSSTFRELPNEDGFKIVIGASVKFINLNFTHGYADEGNQFYINSSASVTAINCSFYYTDSPGTIIFDGSGSITINMTNCNLTCSGHNFGISFTTIMGNMTDCNISGSDIMFCPEIRVNFTRVHITETEFAIGSDSGTYYYGNFTDVTSLTSYPLMGGEWHGNMINESFPYGLWNNAMQMNMTNVSFGDSLVTDSYRGNMTNCVFNSPGEVAINCAGPFGGNMTNCTIMSPSDVGMEATNMNVNMTNVTIQSEDDCISANTLNMNMTRCGLNSTTFNGIEASASIVANMSNTNIISGTDAIKCSGSIVVNMSNTNVSAIASSIFGDSYVNVSIINSNLTSHDSLNYGIVAYRGQVNATIQNSTVSSYYGVVAGSRLSLNVTNSSINGEIYGGNEWLMPAIVNTHGVYIISTNSTLNNIVLYDTSIVRLLNSMINSLSATTNTTELYGPTPVIVSGSSTIVNQYLLNSVRIYETPGENVTIKDYLGNTLYQAPTTSGGYCNVSYLQKYIHTSAGVFGVNHTYSFILPENWSFDNMRIVDVDAGSMNVTWWHNTTTIFFNGLPSDYFAFPLERQEFAVNYTNDNNSFSMNMTPGSKITSDTEIKVQSLYEGYTFTLFYFVLGNFTNSTAPMDISTENYTLSVYLDGTLVGSYSTTNGTVIWTGTFPLGSNMTFKPSITLPMMMQAGNWTAKWTFGAVDGSSTIELDPEITGYVPPFPEFCAGVFGGALTPDNRNLSVRLGNMQAPGTAALSPDIIWFQNVGNCPLYYANVTLSNMSNGSNWITPSFRIREYWGSEYYSGSWVNSSNGSAVVHGIIFPEINLNLIYYGEMPLQIEILYNSSFPSGHYTGFMNTTASTEGCETALFRGAPMTSAVQFEWYTHTNCTLEVNNSIVSLGMSYSAPFDSDPNPSYSSLLFGMMLPNSINLTSENSGVISNVGNLEIDVLQFRIGDLTDNRGHIITIGGNAQVILDGAMTEDVNELGEADFTSLDFMPGEDYPFQVVIRSIAGGQYQGNYSGTFNVTAINEGSRNYDPQRDTVFGRINSVNWTSKSTVMFMSDESEGFSFDGPIGVGDNSTNQLVIQNTGDRMIGSFIFILSNMTPAIYSLWDQYGNEYTPDVVGENCTILANLEVPIGFAHRVEFTLCIHTINSSYDGHTHYDAQEFNITAAVKDIGNFMFEAAGANITVNIEAGTNREISLAPGLHFFSLDSDNSNYETASDLTALDGIDWIARYNSTSSGFDYVFSGLITDFALEYGVGYIVYSHETVEISMTGSIPASVSIGLSSGLSLVAQPTNESIYVADYLENAENVTWVALYDTGAFEYDYFFPSSPGTNNFLIPPNSAVFLFASDEDTIEY